MPRKASLATPVFFVDRSLGGKLVVEALRNAGATVVPHDEVFEQDTKDIEWLAEAGRRHWVVLTKDGAIRRNPHERAMFREARVQVFALARRNLAGPEMADLFVRALPGMIKRAKTIPAPFLYSVLRSCDFIRLD